MKKCLFVLMVGLMATAAFASQSWVGPTGSWGTATLWQNSVLPSDATSGGEVKIIKTSATSLTLDVDAGQFNTTKMTISGNGGLTVNIVAGGKMMSGSEFCVGAGTAGSGVPTGIVNQTGGMLTLNSSATVGKLEIGYKSGSAGVGNGTYTISGGTINGTGGIYVGAFAGTGTGGSSSAIGKLVVQGTGGTVSVGGPLFVGEGDSTSKWVGTGTLQFNINGGVSAIQTSGGVTLNLGATGAVANLLVNLTGAEPVPGTILLVDNTGTSAVAGYFDNAAWNSTFTINGYNYTLVNNYIADGDGQANDIALIPEPVTIALLGLGFLAIRRKK
jgi:hypothetical protein